MRIMFVDDEAMVLSGLRRALSRLRRAWTLEFLEDPEHAAALVAGAAQTDRPVDVIVTDFRMPGMDGLALLEHVQRTSPSTARVILSGQTDGELLLSSLRPTHMFLAKPCDIDALTQVLDRLVRVRALVHDTGLQAMLGGLVALPKAPQSVTDLQRLSADPDATVRDVAAVVEQDVALTAEILKLTNSAFFSLGRTVESAERAVALLGLQTVLGLAASGALLQEPTPLAASLPAGAGPERDRGETLSRGLAGVRDRAIAAAGIVRQIGRRCGWAPDRTADAVLVAVLHDVGLLALAGVAPGTVVDLFDDPDADSPARQAQLLGCPVARASALLMATWGFSDQIVDLLLDQATIDPPACGPHCTHGHPVNAAAQDSPEPRDGSSKHADEELTGAVTFARTFTRTFTRTAQAHASESNEAPTGQPPTGQSPRAAAEQPSFPPLWWQIAADLFGATLIPVPRTAQPVTTGADTGDAASRGPDQAACRPARP